MLDDKLLDLKGLGTNDRADFAQVNALDGLVDHKRLGKQAEHAVQTDARTVQEGRDGHDADIDQQQRTADLKRGAALRIMARMSVPPVEAPISKTMALPSAGRITAKHRSSHISPVIETSVGNKELKTAKT